MDDTDYYDDLGNKICDTNGNSILYDIDIESNIVNIKTEADKPEKKNDYQLNEENLIFLDNLKYFFHYFLLFSGWLYNFVTKYEDMHY